jgi:hypothetical protein
VADQIGSGGLIGCSTAGELAPDRSSGGGLTIWALGGSGFTVATGLGQGSAAGLRQAASDAAHCLDDLQRRAHTVLVLLADGLCGDQMEVVRGAYDVAGVDVPLVGGCAGDDMAMQSTQQIFGRQVLSNAVVAAAISSDRPLGVGVSHGWTPVSEPMLVTDSRDTVLRSLDDRPALEVYLEFFQPPQEVRDNPQAFADFAATHPIAKGLPAQWDIAQTEMYAEPFHVPKPDVVVFEENWDKGETFRSGCVWNIGKGAVFYFRPGHETYPIYQQKEPLQVLENAVRWLHPAS